MSATEPEDLPRVRRLLTGDEPAWRIGKYRIVREVGRGGMGTVYEAFDPDLGRRVALKTLNDSAATPKYVELLRREAAVAARMRHPNIVPVHEVGSVSGEDGSPVHFIAMDFVDGVTLAEQVSRMSRRKRIEVLEILAGAVAFAHEQGVVHRDLKPQNVLLEPTTQNADSLGWRVYLTDFGLAKQMSGEDLTRSGTVMGTPHYMAPEQVRGQMSRMGPWTDVWALGVILYELVTRKSPFEGNNALEVYERIVAHEPKPPRKVERAVHPDLETICLKALEKDPAKRYPMAAGFAEDLRRYLREEPIAARPAGAASKLWKGVKRRPALWGMGLLAAAAIAVAFVFWLGGVGRERVLQEAKKREEEQSEALRRRREEAVQRLSMQWWTIAERKRELRQLRVPLERGRQDLEDAVKAVDVYVREWPGDPQGYYVRAQGRTWLGDLAAAEQDARVALDRRPGFRPAWLLLAALKAQAYYRSLLELSRTRSWKRRFVRLAPVLKEAVEALRTGSDAREGGLIRTREDQVTERVTRALQLHYAEGKTDEARQLLTEGVAEYRAEEYAFWLGVLAPSHAEADRWATQAIEWARGFKEAFYLRASTRTELGDFVGAAEDYDRVIQLDPNDPIGHYNRGNFRAARNDSAGAREDYDRALALDANVAVVYLNRGVLRNALGDREGAEADYRRALELDAELMEAWYNIGQLERDRGETAKAVAAYDRVIALDDTYAAAYVNRGCLRDVSGEWDAARDDFRRATELDPGIPEAWFNLGNMEHHLRDDAKAVAAYDRAIESGASFADAYLNRGVARNALGDRAGARADYRRAVELDPRLANAWFNLGNLEHQEGHETEALAAYDRALLMRKDSSEMYFNRGVLRARRGDSQGAIADFKSALAVAPAEWPNREVTRQLLEAERRKP